MEVYLSVGRERRMPHLWELLGAGWSGKVEKQDGGFEELHFMGSP